MKAGCTCTVSHPFPCLCLHEGLCPGMGLVEAAASVSQNGLLFLPGRLCFWGALTSPHKKVQSINSESDIFFYFIYSYFF